MANIPEDGTHGTRGGRYLYYPVRKKGGWLWYCVSLFSIFYFCFPSLGHPAWVVHVLFLLYTAEEQYALSQDDNKRGFEFLMISYESINTPVSCFFCLSICFTCMNKALEMEQRAAIF
ncbi:hypothetical protein F4781DRAFT_397321 [Annulohypoxylon bovei var. microspora]|nr:hypothetical protein F4781DRAFT_397321 [Annulohypoxylon bovei var. microspora]